MAEPLGAGSTVADADAGAGAEVAVALVRRCRDRGLPVSADHAVVLTRALAAVDTGRIADLYWAGRAVLISAPSHVDAYDRVFAAVFDVGSSATPDAGEPGATSPPLPDLAGGASARRDGHHAPAPDDRTPGYTRRERLRHRDFAACDETELAEARRLLAGIRVRRPRRVSGRGVPAPRGRLDLHGTLRASVRAHGEPVAPRRRRSGTRPRRLVLLCDVSGSMAPYSRELLRFLHITTAGARHGVEAFALGTRLTRLTPHLRTTDPDAALAAVADAVPDWDGGTRLGEGIRVFNDEWGGGPARGAVVVVLSDGWDRGDPAQLAGEMARLRRLAHRVVWVNPLRASPGYEPLAGGMAAALPHVDDFVDGHSVAALEDLVEVIAR
ncbi:MAG: VWA domain-containing protein [Acidimicrobiia bacterium]|nr:VWA domain-containing protein [Acidimicrobiia bacterium]